MNGCDRPVKFGRSIAPSVRATALPIVSPAEDVGSPSPPPQGAELRQGPASLAWASPVAVGLDSGRAGGLGFDLVGEQQQEVKPRHDLHLHW